jgi:hypothetical protein
MGFKKKQIRGIAMPEGIAYQDDSAPSPESKGLTLDFCEQASSINDNEDISEERREAELINLCLRHNTPFVFQFVD